MPIRVGPYTTKAEDASMTNGSDERVTDPVCGMTFRVEKAAASLQYEGRTYYFCAHACHRQFQEDPEKYTRPVVD
jgi:Cu+-exporting ATPase